MTAQRLHHKASLCLQTRGHVERAVMHFGLGDTAVAVRPAP
jgi:hypothetical protein